MRDSRSSICRKRSPRRGAAAVEFAIVLVPLIMLFMVALDFCRLFYCYTTITNCARNGALYLSDPVASDKSRPDYQPSYANYQDAAQADGSKLNPALSTANITFWSGNDADGNLCYKVTVTYDFALISSYLLGDTTIHLTRTVQMRRAQPTPD